MIGSERKQKHTLKPSRVLPGMWIPGHRAMDPLANPPFGGRGQGSRPREHPQLVYGARAEPMALAAGTSGS